MASCHTCIDIIVAMAVPAERPGEVVSTSGTSIVMWAVLSPCKDLAVLVNQGSHVCFHAAGLPRGVFTHCMKIFGMLDCLLGVVGVETIVAGMTRCLEHPRGGGDTKEP